MELDAALFVNASLLDRIHLALELSQLRRHRAIATHEKRCWPKHHDSDSGRDLIVGSLLIMGARHLSSAGRDSLRFHPKLLTGVGLVTDRRNVSRRDVGRF